MGHARIARTIAKARAFHDDALMDDDPVNRHGVNVILMKDLADQIRGKAGMILAGEDLGGTVMAECGQEFGGDDDAVSDFSWFPADSAGFLSFPTDHPLVTSKLHGVFP